MTPRQTQVLDQYRKLIERAQIMPTYREIGRALRISPSSVMKAVDALVVQGALAKVPGQARGVQLIDHVDLRSVESARMVAELQRRGDLVGALARPERMAASRRDVCCAADFCAIVVPRGHAFCADHWRAISHATQQRLYAANAAARRRPSDDNQIEYQEAFQAAKDQADALGRRAA